MTDVHRSCAQHLVTAVMQTTIAPRSPDNILAARCDSTFPSCRKPAILACMLTVHHVWHGAGCGKANGQVTSQIYGLREPENMYAGQARGRGGAAHIFGRRGGRGAVLPAGRVAGRISHSTLVLTDLGPRHAWQPGHMWVVMLCKPRPPSQPNFPSTQLHARPAGATLGAMYDGHRASRESEQLRVEGYRREAEAQARRRCEAGHGSDQGTCLATRSPVRVAQRPHACV